jgi:hypothetical protein
MVKQFSKAAEDTLLEAVREVTAAVEGDDLSPTDAIVKVASEQNLPPTYVPLLVQAYNVGRAAYQREHGGSGVLNKTAEFPIARVEDAMAKLYPEKPAAPSELLKEAVSPEYSRPPVRRPATQPARREKAASTNLGQISTKLVDQPGDPMIKMSKAYGQAQKITHQIEELRYKAGAAKDRLLNALSTLGNYYKQANLDPFEVTEFAAVRMFGEPARHVMGYIHERNRMKTSRWDGGIPKQACTQVDPQQMPFPLIQDVITKGRELLEAQTKYAQTRREGTEKVASILRPFAQTPASILAQSQSALGPTLGSSDKQAGIIESLAAGTVGGAIPTMFTPKPTSEMVESVEQDLSSPVHIDELRQIRSRAMLSDFLANDDVISGYAPEEVTNAYNEISQLSPRASSQPAIMRPLLRKRLTAGSVEPFEAQQMADIEKTIKQTENPEKVSEVLCGNILD